MGGDTGGTIETTDARFEDAIPNADPRLRGLLDVWRESRGAAPIPLRTALDPTAIPKLLPAIWLTQYDRAVDDFRYRLAGEDISEAWGRSIRGMYLRDLTGEADHPEMLRRWKRVIGVPLVHYGKKSEQLSRIRGKSAERLLLPYADEDGVPTFILGFSLYTYDATLHDAEPLRLTDSIQFPVETV